MSKLYKFTVLISHNYWFLNLNELRQSDSSIEMSYHSSLGFSVLERENESKLVLSNRVKE